MQKKTINNLFLESSYLKAARLLEKERKNKPDDLELLELLGFAYEQQAHVHSRGQIKTRYFARARVVFERLQKCDKKGVALRGLGTIKLHQSKFKDAYLLFKRSLKEDPRDTKTLVALGNTSRHLGEYNKALDWYARYRRREGGSWQLYANEAFTARDAGRMRLAKLRAQAALNAWPRNSNPKLAAMQHGLEELTT